MSKAAKKTGKFRIVMAIDPELYEKEFGIKITDPATFMKTMSGVIPQGTRSMVVSLEQG